MQTVAERAWERKTASQSPPSPPPAPIRRYPAPRLAPAASDVEGGHSPAEKQDRPNDVLALAEAAEADHGVGDRHAPPSPVGATAGEVPRCGHPRPHFAQVGVLLLLPAPERDLLPSGDVAPARLHGRRPRARAQLHLVAHELEGVALAP
eukprot:9349786-Pyramimonas_sp.AAC.1